MSSQRSLPSLPPSLVTLGYQTQEIAGVTLAIPPLITIPAGPFLMGSDTAHDPHAWHDETPQHRVEVAAFHIAKYPVTVAEYALAVRAGAVREPPAWKPAPQLVSQGYPDRAITWDTQLQHSDHPVVCVTWPDVMAYIAWLNTATGQQDWRLSTEAEWEKAARWDAPRGVSRLYPWGDHFDTSRCNTGESSIGTTTPVGSYPASDAHRSGASPFGVEEMAGNVFEWTGSLNDPYPYVAQDGREVYQSPAYSILQHVGMLRYIVVRGGSWFSDQRLARAGCRGVEPGTIDLGFRLVRSALDT